MLDPTYPLYPIFAFLSFVLVLVPLPSHIQNKNVGTVSYMLWTAIASLSAFVNNVVWRNDAIDRAPVWCDISSRIIVITNVAVPCASFTITKNLYRITRCNTVTSDPKEKRNQMIVDLLVCVFFPLFQMVLYWFIQGHRYNIFEQLGCQPVAIDTLPTYFLIYMWPLLISLVSAVYGSLAVWSFVKRRIEFSRTMTNSNLNRYFRLMALAGMDICLTIPFSIYTIWVNAVEFPIAPWKGLADVHFGFGRIEQIPAVEWRLEHLFVISVNISRWAIVLCGLVFFAFFGFAEETRKGYVKMYWAVAKRFGRFPKPAGTAFSGSSFIRTPNLANMSSTAAASSSNASNARGNLKVFVNRDAKVKRDSLLSSIADLDSSITVDSAFDERKDEKGRSNDSLPASPDDIELGIPTLAHSNPASRQAHPSEALVLNFPASPRSSRVVHGDNIV